MKYFKVDIKIFEKNDLGSILGSIGNANGEKVSNGERYFSEMRLSPMTGSRRILNDTPMFDYFFLENFDKPSTWERCLNDVHRFTGESPDGWFVSDKFKTLIEQFCVIPQYHFYPSKLLYKGEKLDYWVFQWGVREFSNFDYVTSVFYEEGTNKIGEGIVDFDSFMDYRKNIDEDVAFKKLVLKQPYDFIVGHRLGLDLYMSEKLKIAIETAGIEGLLFEEIDFEIVCD